MNTPDNTINKRNRKRKQDTPQDARGAIRPMKNQRPINAYFEPNAEIKTPGKGSRDNGVSVSKFQIFFYISSYYASIVFCMLSIIAYYSRWSN